MMMSLQKQYTMKNNIPLALIWFLFHTLTTHAQDLQQASLKLSFQKTTTLVFPYAIESVDLGSGDILAQVPDKVENVLQVKAARKDFNETNLTVITADGGLYCFTVSYAGDPLATLFRLKAPPETTAPVVFKDATLNKAQMETISKQVVNDNRMQHGTRDKAGGAKAVLKGIYSYGDILFFRVMLVNTTPIPYKVDFTRFSVRDRKQARRTAAQEQELIPLYTDEDTNDNTVDAGHPKVWAFALKKFALTSSKEMVLDLFEENGSRHLRLKIRAHHLMKALPLSL